MCHGSGAARERPPVSRHLFVDETKHRDYLLVASLHASGDLAELRKLMRGLVLKGQRRVHMKKESDPRRRAIAAAICGAGVSATIYDAGRDHTDQLQARLCCLRALVDDIRAERTPWRCWNKTTR